MPEASPRLRIDAACRRLGRAEVIRRCEAMLVSTGTGDGARDVGDRELVFVLGGLPARHLLASGVPEGQAYWLRVWAARGLLWAGVGESADPLRAALADESWRVREMACKVAARHTVGDLLGAIANLESDPVGRVRDAARRAVVRIVAAAA